MLTKNRLTAENNQPPRPGDFSCRPNQMFKLLALHGATQAEVLVPPRPRMETCRGVASPPDRADRGGWTTAEVATRQVLTAIRTVRHPDHPAAASSVRDSLSRKRSAKHRLARYDRRYACASAATNARCGGVRPSAKLTARRDVSDRARLIRTGPGNCLRRNPDCPCAG